MHDNALEQACTAHASNNGLNRSKKQQDGGLLVSNRVEFKAAPGGWGPNSNSPHLWTDGSGVRWPDTVTGKLYARCVTVRSDPDQDHSKLRATVRMIFQSCSALSALMTYHKCEKMIESQSTPEFNNDKDEDISSLSFDYVLRILFDTKTTAIFPS